MVPSIFGENMLDDFFDGGFFGAHNPLYGKNASRIMKTDIKETYHQTNSLQKYSAYT